MKHHIASEYQDDISIFEPHSGLVLSQSDILTLQSGHDGKIFALVALFDSRVGLIFLHCGHCSIYLRKGRCPRIDSLYACYCRIDICNC